MVTTPHPLAAALIERLQARTGVRVLDFACGSGRNTSALRAAGFTVVAVDDAAAAAEPLRELPRQFDAAISTHGLLHGTEAAIASRVRAIAGCLRSGGFIYATFGSSRDSRFGQGRRIGDWTFAPLEGDEREVPHTYFDRERVAAMLAPHFQIESLEDVGVDTIAGRWAHSTQPLQGSAHWFAIGRRQ